MADYTDVPAVRLALSPGGDESDVGSAASLADSDLQAAVDDATDEINGKIGGRYSLPLVISPTPSILSRIARDIAAYFATLTYRRGDPIVTGDPVQLRYNAAESLLTQIQNGTIQLDPTIDAGASNLVPVFPDTSGCNSTLYDGYNGPLDYPAAVGLPKFIVVQ